MRITLLLPATVLLLTACAPAPLSIESQNENPLTASRYGDELADTMAKFIINNDPILEDASMRTLIEDEIEKGKDISERAQKRQNKGLIGGIISMKASVLGYVLLIDKTLFLSSDFATSPGPSLHIYLSTVIDPRDADFPDDTAMDLGPLQAAYGQQQYKVSTGDPEKLRSFVLYDTRLKMIYGFAQISRTY